ncbi:glycoside hydrolase family 19 protein [Burkholderia lata]|uniref:Calcium-binding protein n=1 Tax=Burkholderia lata (strain ATCC 17760 / DSM 23089 / LMG 22485 / NCIMB 9086 / R18194 / 383) TaxID=482957 RepID=A0A6P3AMV4_BURL3|nr:glycoside hydrolase family 19 protein [Burkholderia lata]VWD44009.1 calcium-binding protein [Burkholderia lata]
MPNKPAPNQGAPATEAAIASLKQLPFAFPFLRKGRSKSEASAQFTDENEIYRLLAERESSGAYLVSCKGMWHGGIHVTEAGAGQSLDLDAGLRCVADGVLIAFRANKTYPISEIAVAGGKSPVQAPYSTGFALVRHTMEFPRGTKLTFYSLYMHLMSWEDYANFPKREKPSYWSRQWQVTQYARDKPSLGRNGQVADPLQQGLRVRKGHPHGEIIGIAPQGASVSIGKREKGWGQLTELHGTLLYPSHAGDYVDPSSAVGGWVYLGRENGGPLVEDVIPDTMFDRVIVTANQTCTRGDSQGDGGIPIKAGDLIGHLGRYDSLNQCTSGTRMAHIEVFCDDSIQSFLEQGRAWVNQHGPHKKGWSALGLPSEPTILRIAPGTVLYQRQDEKFVPGTDPQSRKTDTVQVYSLAELAREPQRRVAEPNPNLNPGYPVNWWHVESVNAQGQQIDGWVCDFNHPSGRVTREFAQKWIDFQCLADAHDPAHAIFTTTQKWADYASGANDADLTSRSNLSPLMVKVYDALFTKGDGKHAVDELCTLSQTEHGGYPWPMQAASRLIVKHESEWANPSKWKQLIAELEKQTGPKPQHEEERKRIDNLAWWDELRAHVLGFPAPNVFHVNPIGLIWNFSLELGIITLEMLAAVDPNGNQNYHRQILPALNKYAKGYQVTTPKRIAHFLSQIAVESGFKNVEEGLSYSSKRMKQIFGCNPAPKGKEVYSEVSGDIVCNFGRRRDKLWTETSKYEHNAKNLASYVYADRYKNGDEESGDGYKYRGRGLIQTTFKGNYMMLTDEHNRRFPNDRRDFVENPDLVLSDFEYGIESAFVFWAVTRNVNGISDSGNVLAVSKAVNGGKIGYSERLTAYNNVAPILGLQKEVV